jgi:small nuclear ribonucleoprotein (snRNP)-like protein
VKSLLRTSELATFVEEERRRREERGGEAPLIDEWPDDEEEGDSEPSPRARGVAPGRRFWRTERTRDSCHFSWGGVSCATKKIRAAMAGDDASEKEAQKKGRHGHGRTLGGLLRHLRGAELTVELKSGRTVRGTLVDGDGGSMGLVLADAAVVAVWTRSGGGASAAKPPPPPKNPATMALWQVRGSSVRYIHLPNTDLAATVRRGMDRERSARQKYKRGVRKGPSK